MTRCNWTASCPLPASATYISPYDLRKAKHAMPVCETHARVARAAGWVLPSEVVA